eukprot:288727_1
MDTSTEHIIIEGFLQKKSKYLGIYRKRWMVLTDKYLYSYKKKQIYKSPTEKFNLSNFQDVIKGRNPVLRTWDGSFGLSSISATKKSRWFLSGSINEMMHWVDHIKCKLNQDNIQLHKNSDINQPNDVDASSRKTSNISDTSTYNIKYILDNESFTSNNTYNTDINYNMSLTTDTLNTDLDYVNDIYEGVLEIQNDEFIEYDKYNYNNYEPEEKMIMKRDSVPVQQESSLSPLSNNDSVSQYQIYDSKQFNDSYIIGDKINDGTFGSVWRIHNNELKCVKIIDLDRDVNGESENGLQMRKQAAICEYKLTQKAFNHECIGIELFIDDICSNQIESPRAYLIMPYFNGKDLFEFIDGNYEKQVNVGVYLGIFCKIMEILYELHYIYDIIHGDLKLENIMILGDENDGDNIQVKIIDYGIAKSIENYDLNGDNYIETKGCFGTKGYIAPEIYGNNKYNRKIDVFSCGVILYSMITERFLFPKGYAYYNYAQGYYYKYLKKKFKKIKRKKVFIKKLLYSCLAFDPDQRLDVKQLLQKYFDVKK